MPRRLIIGVLIVLILGILGGTVVLVLQRLRQGQEASPTPTPGGLQPADVGNQQVANPTGDDDNDGLLNADEAVWTTNRNNPDTDGDGFQDGEEVRANHNPTIAGPNDLLPAGFRPGQDLQPLADSPLKIDDYFASNLDLTGGSRNLTEAYKSQVAEKDRSTESMANYARQQPIITQLPQVRDSALKVSSDTTQLGLNNYLGTAGNLSAISDQDLVSQGLNDLVQNNDPSTLRNLSAQIRSQQQTLLALPVPPSAVNLHKVLLAYTELLAATFDQIALWPQDPVKALVALRQLETIDGRYYPLIVQELARLGG